MSISDAGNGMRLLLAQIISIVSFARITVDRLDVYVKSFQFVLDTV